MKTANGQDLVRLDFEFHVGLIECTENPLLITVSRPVAELYIKSMSNVIENADEMIRENFYLYIQVYWTILLIRMRLPVPILLINIMT